MAMDREWKQEQKRVDAVVRKIDRQIQALRRQTEGIKENILEISRNFWDDVTLNFSDPHDTLETIASINQQARVMAERERSFRHARRRLTTLVRMKDSPYFGRIDFVEDGESKAEAIYLGIATVRDEEDELPLVYDWRAPIASLYYEGSPGPVRYKTPAGEISGNLKRKRQFIIRDGRIRSMFDTSVTIGDELLQEVLGRHSDTQMKNIVATIQKEQNRIIRNEGKRLLVVSGAAGSGKTSTALQRVAWLLYRYRKSLTAKQVVLFSPNPMFNSYVSTVLPGLGEENMQQTTFQEMLEHRLGKRFRLEDPYDQMEYVLQGSKEPGYDERLQGIRFKTSTRFMEVIDRYLERLRREGLIFRNITFNDRVLISAEEIESLFYALDPSRPISGRLSRLAEQLLDRLDELADEEKDQPWVEDEIELLDAETYQRAYKELQRQKGFSGNGADDFKREREWLASFVVKERFRPLKRSVRRYQFVDIPALYRRLFSDPDFVPRMMPDIRLPQGWEAICAQTAERLDRKELAYEDATPFLYLTEKIEGFHTNPHIRHVFVDEAQDYSPFQFAFLKHLFPRASMTVLGDFNQAIFISAESGFDFLTGLFGADETDTFILTRSYRSTRQIVLFTRELIEGGDRIEPFHRDGPKPTWTQVEDREKLYEKISGRIRSLQDAGHRTIAIICKSGRESREAYEGLKKHCPGLRLIEKETVSFDAGPLVIPSYLAKGLEFDAVIVFDAQEARYGRESERKLFYTVCTRAMHELHLYCAGKATPFLSDVSPDLYVVES